MVLASGGVVSKKLQCGPHCVPSLFVPLCGLLEDPGPAGVCWTSLPSLSTVQLDEGTALREESIKMNGGGSS